MSKAFGLRGRKWYIPVHSFAQTCKTLRQVSLPLLWRSVKLEQVGDVKHYVRFLETVPTATESYGNHVRTFSFKWIWEDEYSYDGLFKEALKQQVELEDPFNHDNYDYHPVFEEVRDLIDAIGRIITRMPNITHLDWCAYIMPLPKSLAQIIEQACPKLHTVEIKNEFVHREAFTSVIPALTKNLKTLRIEDEPTGSRLPNNEDSDYWVQWNANKSFCISMKEPDQALYAHGKNCVHWAAFHCRIGAENNLQKVEIPYAAAFTIELLYPLWLSLELTAPNYTDAIKGSKGEEGLQVQGWAKGFGYVRSAILSLRRGFEQEGWVEEVMDRLRKDDRIQRYWAQGQVIWSDDEELTKNVNDLQIDEPWQDENEAHVEDNVGRVAAHKALSIIETLREDEKIRMAVEKWFHKESRQYFISSDVAV